LPVLDVRFTEEGPGVTFGDARLPGRFWAKVTPEPNSGCWLWAAATGRGGYGMYALTKRHHVSSHRLAYEVACGPIPEGLVVHHRCDTPACVNPDHLVVVTQRRNVLEGAATRKDGRCRRRHEMTPENTYVDPYGKGTCRECVRLCRRVRADAVGVT
jgi:hypothetical protein